MSELRLPTEKNMRNCQFLVPGPKIVKDMQDTFAAQREEMNINRNKSGRLSTSTRSTGDTPSLEYRFRNDKLEANRFSCGEIVANVLDVSATAGVLCDNGIVFVTDTRTQAVSLTRGDGEGFAGFAPTSTGVKIWNLSTPFSPRALVRGGENRPKLLTKNGTGGYNCGLKQAIKNLLASNIRLGFEFYGYDTKDLTAKSTYGWKPDTKEPHTIKFTQTPTLHSKEKYRVPVLVQTLSALSPPQEGMPAFTRALHARFAEALSTFERIFKYDAKAGPVMRGMCGACIMHRDCFSPLLPAFGAAPIVLPPGPLVLVGERFYPVSLAPGKPLNDEWRKGLGSLIVRVPGKGMNDPYNAFSDESRQVLLHTYTNLVAQVIVDIIAAAEKCDRRDCETLAIRKELATQLMPLLVGGESPVFGSARGKLIDTLLGERRITHEIDALRNLLVREQLRGSPQAAELTSEEFERKIVMRPLVHSGNVARATVLAHLVDTLQLSVDPNEVHPLLYKTTNMQAAERRAAEDVHLLQSSQLPEGLAQLADYVLGVNTKVAFLPLPQTPHLRNAAVPFRYDDDACNTHLAVMWERVDDPRAQIEELCALRVTGVKLQMDRSVKVLYALSDAECAYMNTENTCFKILSLLRAVDDDGDANNASSDSDVDNLDASKSDGDGTSEDEASEDEASEGEVEVEDNDSDDCDVPVLSAEEGEQAVAQEPPTKRARTNKYTPEPGSDVLQNLECVLSDKVVVSPSDTCTYKEPFACKDLVLTHVNQVLIELAGVHVYVPLAEGKDVDDFPSSSLPKNFLDLHNVYYKASVQVVKHLGFGTTKVAASWSPKANWAGLSVPGENIVLVNLASGFKTQGEFEGVLMHELAHTKCSAGCGHNLEWSTKLEAIYAAFTDVKYAQAAR